MSGRAKVSEQQIRDALKVWHGNVAATAEALGISENPLRRRLARMGIGDKALSFLRSTHTHTHPHPSDHTTPQGIAIATRTNPPKSASPTFPGSPKAPTLLRMPSAEVAEPIRRTKAGPIRLRPDQVEALRDAKFDFMAKYRTEASEADLLQRFFAEQFGDWLKRALGKEKAKA